MDCVLGLSTENGMDCVPGHPPWIGVEYVPGSLLILILIVS